MTSFHKQYCTIFKYVSVLCSNPGSYFARDAKYSHSYTDDSTVKAMFVAQVLVGDFTKGSSSYRRAPSKDGGDVNFYHSCVDDVFNPSIFVVFKENQIYPEYLLKYKTTHPLVSAHSTPTAAAPRPAPAPAPRTVSTQPAAAAAPRPAASYQPSTPAYFSTTPIKPTPIPPSRSSYRPTPTQPSTSSYQSSLSSYSSSTPAQPSASRYQPSSSFSSFHRVPTPPPPPPRKSSDSCVIA